jgi:hypothetical protein
MHTTDALAVTPDLRVAVAIDLIGDLDATLGVIFSDALSHLVDQGTTDVLLMTRHVSVTSIDGALGAARAKGCSILVEPGSRRMKAAFAAAHVSVATAKEERRRSARHVMIARHAAQPSLKHTA